MDRYEISLWEDYIDGSTLKERKIVTIGSDSMTTQGVQARAIEPNLVEEINGSYTFTFKMYYVYTDNITGQTYANPFQKYLVNERKVKVYWKNKWYDLVIKKAQEDTSKKIVTYTCQALFINELSQQGYSLEFDTELENNIGTVDELAQKVLEGSTWNYDSENSEAIIQETVGPVYEVIVNTSFEATKQSAAGDIPNQLILADKKILLFYDSIVNIDNAKSAQFIYSSNGYETDINDSLVINGNCYEVTLTWEKEDNLLKAYKNSDNIFTINLDNGVSQNYTAARLVRSQKTEYDSLLDRYVLLCSDGTNEIYEIATTEYTNPLTITNLIVNPNGFVNTAGWIGAVEEFGVYPKFDTETDITEYHAKSYLKINSGVIYNTAIQSNIAWFKANEIETKSGIIGGIQKGEKYVFRIKLKTEPTGAYLTNTTLAANLYQYEDYTPVGNSVFTLNDTITNEDWIENILIANLSISASDVQQYGFFIESDGTYWIEDVQFFKYAEGVTSYAEDAEVKRINPGEIDLQSVVVPVYKYYLKNNQVQTAEELTFLNVSDVELTDVYTPVYNNYEKIITLQQKESNRFNILQTIAETAQAWVKFRIDHEDNGAIKIIDSVPQKFIYFVQNTGEDTGLSFEYGIDLKSISRNIVSDKLATKIIVRPNNNEFAKNGFCSISRSSQNYSKENFILNLDYYTQQNLLDADQLNLDLYSTDSNYLGYYYNLHSYNTEYDQNVDELQVRNLDLVRQNAQQEVYKQYLLAAEQQKTSIEVDVQTLAGVSQWTDAEAYAREHCSQEKVQALLNAYAEVNASIITYSQNLAEISTNIETLTNHINDLQSRQSELINLITQLHLDFNNKYSTYLLEGTWQDESYIDDDKYYLDALNVAYTSSRPQLSYTINVLRLSSLEEYSSKIFNLGDICYMQDREFFGYLPDGITPYKEKILVSKISSFFDQPQKDVLTVQNYKTRFDDLFQRITATTQSLQYAEGSYSRAAAMVNTDNTLNFSDLQNTFDQNYDLVLNSSNQDIVWDETGITLTNKFNSGDKTKIIAGGVFISNDGGITWKNAIRGDGISTELLTAGRINTSEIYIYDGNAPSFRWDSTGLTAYSFDENGVNFHRFVRHDKFGFYGYDGDKDFIPISEDDIWNNATFGLTWRGFFLKNSDANARFEISTDNDLIIEAKYNNTWIDRIRIGRIDNNGQYGIQVKDSNNSVIFLINNDGATIAGWKITSTGLRGEDYQGNYAEMLNSGIIRGGNITSSKGWEIKPDGSFSLLQSTMNTQPDQATSQIQLGPTIINQYHFQTSNSYITGGSIGGCIINPDRLSGNGWELSHDGVKISISGLTQDGTLLNPEPVWDTIGFISSLASSTKISGTFIIPTAINASGAITSYVTCSDLYTQIGYDLAQITVLRENEPAIPTTYIL